MIDICTRTPKWISNCQVWRWIAMAIAMVSFPTQAICQIPPLQSDSEQWHVGYELFHYMLEERGLKTVLSAKEASGSPTTTVVVLAGDLGKVLHSEWIAWEKFVNNGGSLLIATDQSTHMYGFGQVRQGPVSSRNLKQQYLGHRDCLKIDTFTGDPLLTRELHELIANRSGWLVKPTEVRAPADALQWEVIASFPEIRAAAGSLKPLVAICKGKESLGGIAILSSDASLFSNGMLWHGDNGAFAVNVAERLCDPNKKQLLFLVNGVPVPSYPNRTGQASSNEMPDVPSVDPDLPSLLRFANLAMKKVADSGVVNAAIMNQPRNMSVTDYFHWFWKTLAVGVTAILMASLLKRRNWLPPFLNFRRMKSMHEMQTVGIHPLNRNSQAAAPLARDFCRRWTGQDSVEDWQLYLSSLQSNAKVGSEFLRTPREREQIKSIFEIAIKGCSSIFSDDQLKDLGHSMRVLLNRLPSR